LAAFGYNVLALAVIPVDS